MGSKSKRKGKRFEDEIANKIAKALGLDKKDCHRSSFSGNSSWEYGDIYVKDYPIVVECKNHNEFDIRFMIPSFNKTLKKWIEQLENSVNKYKKDFNKDTLSFLAVSKPYYPEFYIFKISPNNTYFNKFIEFMDSANSFLKINEYYVLFNDNTLQNLLKYIFEVAM